MKSTAPAFIARTASGTSPCPVITISGNENARSTRCCCNSSPSISGMRISAIRQPGPQARRRGEKLAAPPRSCHVCSPALRARSEKRVAHCFVIVDDVNRLTSRHRQPPPHTAPAKWCGNGTASGAPNPPCADLAPVSGRQIRVRRRYLAAPWPDVQAQSNSPGDASVGRAVERIVSVEKIARNAPNLRPPKPRNEAAPGQVERDLQPRAVGPACPSPPA